MRRLAVLGLVLTLTACAGGQKPQGSPPGGPPTPELPEAPGPTPGAAVTPAVPPETRPMASISGTVTYRLRVALTPEAEVQVELRDVSRQDAEAPLLAKRLITKPGQVPIAFTLEYDPSLIEPGHTYAVSARITDRGQLQFVTDTRVTVLTGAAAATPIEIVVVPVR